MVPCLCTPITYIVIGVLFLGEIMKKYEISLSDAISVYQFMDMCGLQVEKRKNILVSHKIMMRKLKCRGGMVTIPIRVPFDILKNPENVKSGSYILVKDDYNKVFSYKRPTGLRESLTSSEEKRRTRREELIEEYIEEREDVLKPGYIKYLLKKEKKEDEEKVRLLKEELALSKEEEKETVTQKVMRKSKVEARRNHY